MPRVGGFARCVSRTKSIGSTAIRSKSSSMRAGVAEGRSEVCIHVDVRPDSDHADASPVRNASSNSDRADWDKAIGGTSFFSACLAAHTEDPADGRLHRDAPQRSHQPHHPQGR